MVQEGYILGVLGLVKRYVSTCVSGLQEGYILGALFGKFGIFMASKIGCSGVF